MNLKTAALAAVVALTAPTAAHADFWTDFFGNADEVKRVHFGVHVSGENGLSSGGTVFDDTDEVTFQSLGTFNDDFECDLRVIESCEHKATLAQIFKIVRKPNPQNEDELLYDIYYRGHGTTRKPDFLGTYKWEDLLEPITLPVTKHQARRVKNLTIKFYEAGQ